MIWGVITLASLFTQIDDVKVRGAFGVESSVPFYLQFVPGTVVDVISNPQSIIHTMTILI